MNEQGFKVIQWDSYPTINMDNVDATRINV